jgi:NADPH:quinone reductase-like Zn-dependent oxidoreductase
MGRCYSVRDYGLSSFKAVSGVAFRVTYLPGCAVLSIDIVPESRSGYTPIAVTSTSSAALTLSYGAVDTVPYTLPAPTCIERIKSVAGGQPIRHVLDCITSEESAAVCFSAIARTGGRYACLEGLPAAWRTRRAIQVKEVMGFEGLGARIDLGDTPYSRDANPRLAAICAAWTEEMQWALDAGQIRCHPIREVAGRWEGILEGLELLQKGEVRGQKLVVRITTVQ